MTADIKAAPTSPAAPATLPLNVATRLGWVSFFNDCSSEVLARALPLVLTVGLGASPTFVGAVEGAAEAVAILLKGVSGWLSDRMESRKPLVVFGYTLSLLARALLLCVGVPMLFGFARILERTGKGLRSAPRDAMVADGAAAGMNGTAFGITRFLDTLGAISGILVVLAVGVGDGPMTTALFDRLVWLALPFGAVAVLLLVLTVPRITRATKAKKGLAWHVPTSVRGYLVCVALFALANSSDAFLVLKATELGYSFRGLLLLMVAFNGLAAALAWPIGRLTDHLGRASRVWVLAAGWLVYAAAYWCFGSFASKEVFAGALFVYGAFYGFTEGTEKALFADLLAPDERGTGYGCLQLVMGIMALPASLVTGWLMTTYGSALALNAAGSVAAAAAFALAVWALRRRA